jgi:hypothetical protein
MTELPSKSRKSWLFNVIFILLCGGIFLFLYSAPPETTKHLPNDDIHGKYFGMDKKEAEKECESCHNPKGEAPLPKGHPPKYRCLFCHKRQ